MKKRQPLSIRHTLWLAVGLTVSSTILGASALYSYHLHGFSWCAAEGRVRAVAETYATQLEPLILGIRSDLKRFVEQIVWHPDTCLLAVQRVFPHLDPCRQQSLRDHGKENGCV